MNVRGDKPVGFRKGGKEVATLTMAIKSANDSATLSEGNVVITVQLNENRGLTPTPTTSTPTPILKKKEEKKMTKKSQQQGERVQVEVVKEFQYFYT